MRTFIAIALLVGLSLSAFPLSAQAKGRTYHAKAYHAKTFKMPAKIKTYRTKTVRIAKPPRVAHATKDRTRSLLSETFNPVY